MGRSLRAEGNRSSEEGRTSGDWRSSAGGSARFPTRTPSAGLIGYRREKAGLRGEVLWRWPTHRLLRPDSVDDRFAPDWRAWGWGGLGLEGGTSG